MGTPLQIIGKSIYQGRYTLLEAIASGGFATVYRASEIDRNRDVAIKLCHVPDDPNYTKSLLKEAEVIQRFNDPRIVKLYPIPRVGKADVYHAQALEVPGHPPFFVMEYLVGGTLNEYLEQVGPLSVPEAAAIGLEVARGLDHMHLKKYTHNDLKLENIVFREPVEAGKPFQPVLIDFGIAARLQLPDAGSLYIMPPEQLSQLKLLTPPELSVGLDRTKVDVWGIGVVLYRMLGGRLPFTARNEKSLTHLIMSSRPESLHKLKPEVTPEVEALIIDGCLAKDPHHRLSLLEVGKELAQLGKHVVASKSAMGRKKGGWLFGRGG
jgi:serine/threonine protein kinase